MFILLQEFLVNHVYYLRIVTLHVSNMYLLTSVISILEINADNCRYVFTVSLSIDKLLYLFQLPGILLE